MTGSKAWIAAPAGLTLSQDERRFFADERPWGFILFARNIQSGRQVADLVASLKEIGGRATTPIFIDQEGGRINRLRPPLAPAYPAPAAIGELFAADRRAGERAAWLQGRLLAADVMAYGINADCVPCLDVPVAGAHSVIGDRAYGLDADTVATLGRAVADGAMAGGVLPVMKHVPGHGRGNADSHHELPRVDAPRAELARTDFAPFRALHTLPAAMTAHILYTDIDPRHPATLSKIVIDSVIRTEIGFDGLLMSDDMSMKALSGDLYDLSAAALMAGCDVVLHCNGDMAEMRRVASAAQPLSGDARRRAEACEAVIARSHDTSTDGLRAEYDALMARVG
ncbi:beta-N-acetylhexosaminidase [Aurantimonas sp. 22II-16-19i]|uniref:beta-N-acetylhexosaminidase n=1 Tax=Aurantimonas sp. 22II-16-19i TaxID=1317114 RepID=UPI0009F7D9B4|nr:beta-N-acetylhexosaminidase [Aurantimonas sp. 22II-16-19i]ORE98253.1 beta-N-acetylhexosaminidase [Aurantimonas sp. 22II-16-19i]